MAIVEGNCVYYTEHAVTFLSSLHQLYTSNLFVDMCIVCHGSEVFAHKAVMAAASPLLRDRINEFGDCQARINLEQEVNGVEINAEDIKLLIEYIYKGQVCIPETRLSAFLEVGSHFQVLGLNRQSSNFGSQASFLSSPITNYNIPQHPLPNTNFGTLQCQENLHYEDPHNLQNDCGNPNFPSFFSNTSFMSPEKLSDSTIKQDKSLSVPVSNATFSDLCAGNGPVEFSQLVTERNFHLNIEEANPKLWCEFQHYTNDASVQDVRDFSTITTTSNPFQSDFSESSLQVQSEHSKDILFEDRASLSSSGASDPDVLITNLSNQPNSFFSCENLGPTNATLPERQMRLKVKDSIGGVSLQDTSQGEKNNIKELLLPIEEIHITHESLPTADQSNTEEILEEIIEPFEEQDKDHVCSQCQKCFPSLDDLTDHLYEEHNIGTLHKCLICSFKTLVENHLVEHGKTHLGSSDRQCCICGKRFKTRATLRNHLACHASNKWFRCKECSKHYSQRNNLKKHLASKHRLDMKGSPIKEPLNCSECSFETWAAHKLKNHEVRCHTKDKPFKCPHCPYSATERTSLVKHIRTHTQEKPYVCDSCGICFVTVSSLKRHCRGHTKEKPFQCMECDKQYADKKRLKDHYLKHKSIKPFKCPDCDYTCRRKDNLQSHSRRNHPASSIKEIIIEDVMLEPNLVS